MSQRGDEPSDRVAAVVSGEVITAAGDPSQLEAFFEASLDLLLIRDDEFNIVKLNRAWERTLGYSLDQLEGRPMLDFVHPDDMAATLATMQHMASTSEVNGFVNRYRHSDGSYRHLEWRARQEGRLVYGVARDITERLALEAEMARAKAEAEAANEAKSDFLANMSHEIRTPLNGVLGVAAALSRTGLSAAQREMVDLILASGATLERVVSDVLDISKIEAGRLDIEPAPFEPRRELEGLLGVFKARCEEKGLAFDVVFGPEVQGVYLGDAVRIKQVLVNLVSNAVKFTERGGVRVSVDLTAGDDGAAQLAISVEDSGIGFDEDFARGLFQRFGQADGSITRRFGGSGLGLSICRALVEMMGGEIGAASTPGEGSRFVVRLPLKRVAAGALMPGEPSDPVLNRHDHLGLHAPLQILVAEDHEVNQRVIELILEPLHAQLTKAADGAEAVRAFEARRFDLVLMDMQMPVMDGLTATRMIRVAERQAPERGRTPVIMLSANAMLQHREVAEAAGVDLHLAKPVRPAELLDAIARFVDAEAGVAI